MTFMIEKKNIKKLSIKNILNYRKNLISEKREEF